MESYTQHSAHEFLVCACACVCVCVYERFLLLLPSSFRYMYGWFNLFVRPWTFEVFPALDSYEDSSQMQISKYLGHSWGNLHTQQIFNGIKGSSFLLARIDTAQSMS